MIPLWRLWVCIDVNCIDSEHTHTPNDPHLVGPKVPATPEAVSVNDTQIFSAIIQWTVPSIAYTPETYVVKYGTSQDNLNLTSDSQHSGPDITIGCRTYQIPLHPLKVGTDYYFVVAANNSHGTTSSSTGMIHTLELGIDA